MVLMTHQGVADAAPRPTISGARGPGSGLLKVGWARRVKRRAHDASRAKSKRRPRSWATGAHRSPRHVMRSRTLSIRKSSMATPRVTSSHVTGVDTEARGCVHTEQTDASVRPHAFWL